jgi:hypothetical protein
MEGPALRVAADLGSEPDSLTALIDYSDDALLFFEFQTLSLAFCNAVAAKVLRKRNCSPQPGIFTVYDLTTALFGGCNQSVVDEMLARFQQGHAYVWEPRCVAGSIVSGFSAKYYTSSGVEGILVKAKRSDEEHGGISSFIYCLVTV